MYHATPYGTEKEREIERDRSEVEKERLSGRGKGRAQRTRKGRKKEKQGGYRALQSRCVFLSGTSLRLSNTMDGWMDVPPTNTV